MCEENNTWELRQQAQEFFVYTTLGIVPEKLFDDDSNAYCDYINKLLKKEDNEDDIIKKNEFSYELYCAFMCAKAAYNDLCRTLRYKDIYKSEKKENEKNIRNKRSAVNDICFQIATKVCDNKKINEVFTVFGEFEKDDKFTINKELDLIKNYLAEGNDGEKLHFGQVQKWVNMTLKYMYLLDKIKDDSGFDVPVDSYILKAINTMSSSAWSKLDYEKYLNIQGEIKKNRDEKSPMIWEHEAWIKQSEKEKGVN